MSYESQEEAKSVILTIEDILPTAAPGQALVFDEGKWVAQDILPTADPGQALVFDEGKWVAQTLNTSEFTTETLPINHTSQTAISNTTVNTILEYDIKPGWIGRLQTNSDGRGCGVAVVEDGIICVVSCNYPMEFKVFNADGTVTLPTFIHEPNAMTAAVIKYNKQGVSQWYARFKNMIAPNAPHHTYVDRIVTDGSNVYIISFSSYSLAAWNSDGTQYPVSFPWGFFDVGIVSYDKDGSVRWMSKYGSNGEDYSGPMCTYDGNLYSSASTTNTLTAYNSDTTQYATQINAEGGWYAATIKYNSAGMIQSIYKIQSTAVGGQCSNLSLSPTLFGIYITFYTTGTSATLHHIVNGSVVSSDLTMNNSQWTNNNYTGNKASGIAYYTHDGYAQWITNIAGTSNSSESNTYIYGTSYNDDLYAYVNYRNANQIVYDSGGSVFGNLRGFTGDNVALVKYNKFGKCQYAYNIATPGMVISDIKVDDSGIYIAGSFSADTITIYNFDGTEFGSYSKTPGSYENIFTIKFDHEGNVKLVGIVNGNNRNFIYNMALDNGDIYLMGVYQASNLSVTLPNGQNQLTIGNTYNYDNCIIKYAIKGLASLPNPSSQMQKTISLSSVTHSNAEISLDGELINSGKLYNRVILKNTGSSITMTWNGTNWLLNGGVNYTLLSV